MFEKTVMDSLHRDSVALTDECVSTFALELESLIRDEATREAFLRRWRAAIQAEVKESVETTGSLSHPPQSRLTPKSRTQALIEALKKTPPSTERPLHGTAFKQKIPESSVLPALPSPEPPVEREWVLTEDDALEVAAKYAIRVYGIRAGQDAKRKRGTHGHGALGFSHKTGSYFLILTDGFLQLGNGMIECFFKRAEITMHGFFID